MPEFLVPVFVFTFGLLFGSFLNVVIHRLPRAESETSTWWVGYSSLVNPRRSQCPKCGHAITWYENIPVFSWLALRGRCAGCKAPISPRYVLVELLTGLLFIAALVRFGLTYPLLPALVFIVLVVPLVFIDAEHWILPFELTLPGIVLGVVLAIPVGWEAVRNALIGASVSFLLFRGMEYLGWLLFRKEALGAGDKYLLALLGAFLGWRPLFAVLFLSSLQGAIFGLANLGLRGRAGPDPAPDDATKPAAPEAAPSTDGSPTTAPAGVTTDAAPATDTSVTPPTGEPEGDDEPELTFTPDVLKPGHSFGKRLALLPWSLFLQPIPDDPPMEPTQDGEAADEPEWTPGATSLPFGPWIGLAGLEVMLLAPWLKSVFAGTGFALTLDLLFGPVR